MRQAPRRAIRRVLLLAVASSMVAQALDLPRAFADSIDECVGSTQPDWCLDLESGDQTGQGDGQGDRGDRDLDGADGGGVGGDEPEECEWAVLSDDLVPPPAGGVVNGEPPEGTEVSWQGWCFNLDGASFPAGPFRWVPVGEGEGVTVGDVAGGLYERVEGRVPDPVVVTDPPVGVDAVVSVPVFVEVTNWTGELVESERLGPATVTVRARPEVVLEPGEPGAGPVVCAGAGRAYDPDGGDLWAQAAAPDACTYAFGQRTGVEGRPEVWPFSVGVRWSISWSASSGEAGSFPAVERSVSVPRGVVEVTSVVEPRLARARANATVQRRDVLHRDRETARTQLAVGGHGRRLGPTARSR